MNCLNCKTDTTNPKFCSRSCAAVFNNKVYNKRTKTKKCSCCETLVLSNRKYCSDCFKKTLRAKDMTLGQSIYEEHHRSSAFALVRSRARSIMKEYPQVCSKCGYSKHVEVAHIKAINSFSDDALLSEINALSNLILLCPNCHWEFDNIKAGALSN